MMTKIKILAGAAVLSLGSVALYAAPGAKADANGDRAVSKSEAMTAADARFARMDANGDGALNEADKAAMVRKHFAEMDADKNGSLSEAEFVAAHEARVAKRADRRERRLSMAGQGDRPNAKGRHGGRHDRGMKMLARADANGDKSVSRAEFRALAEARFAKADANGDGSVTMEERRAGRQEWRRQRPAAPADQN